MRSETATILNPPEPSYPFACCCPGQPAPMIPTRTVSAIKSLSVTKQFASKLARDNQARRQALEANCGAALYPLVQAEDKRRRPDGADTGMQISGSVPRPATYPGSGPSFPSPRAS